MKFNKKGIISADEYTFRTSNPKVFAVGDATNKGASIAIAAIGEANKAADVVDSYLKGDIVPFDLESLNWSKIIICTDITRINHFFFCFWFFYHHFFNLHLVFIFFITHKNSPLFNFSQCNNYIA